MLRVLIFNNCETRAAFAQVESEYLMARKIISGDYDYRYYKGLLDEGQRRFGSLRQLAFALGIAGSVLYRWYHGEQKMGKLWVENLEHLLKEH